MPAETEYQDNPTDPKELDKLKSDKRRFVVQHTGVGRSQKGETVGLHAFGPGAQIARLVELGAIAPTDDAADEPAREEAVAGEEAEGQVEVLKARGVADAGPSEETRKAAEDEARKAHGPRKVT